jgi:hypothetical protein
LPVSGKLVKNKQNNGHYKMAARVHRPLNVKGSAMSSVKSCKSYIYIYMCGFAFKPHEKFSVSNYHFYRIDLFRRRKSGTVAAVTEGFPHNHEDNASACFNRSHRVLHTDL